MTTQYRFLATLLVSMVTLVTGCSNKPPGCADPQTIDTAKTMAVENTGKLLGNRQAFEDDPDGWMKKFYAEMKVEITGIVSDGYKQDAKKQLCKGTLKITTATGRTLERSVEYSTQKTEDQKDAFLLEIQDFTAFALGTSAEARKYFEANRWTGTWNGSYACSGVNGATDGPQGPYSLPVSMVVQGTDAKLERTTRGGGVEMLNGKFDSLFPNIPFKLTGEGQNSPEDKWTTNFSGTVSGKRLVADGAITVRGETLRQCKLDLTLGGSVAQQTTSKPPTVVQSNAGFSGRFASHGESDVTAEIGQVNAAGKYPVNVTTKGQTSGGGTCGGGVEGLAEMTGTLLKLNAVSNGEKCELALSLEPDGKLKLAESQGCSYFHGAACGFNDTLARTR
jgi:hypothetical protein